MDKDNNTGQVPIVTLLHHLVTLSSPAFRGLCSRAECFVLTIVCLLILSALCNAKGSERYKDAVFAQFKMDSVQYCIADGHALLMDVYQPVGDTAALRPLVIFAHGGSFMHNNRRSEFEERGPAICRQLAQRGYVAVSIDYRLTNLFGMATKAAAYKEIIKSVADGRASIAWFVSNIASGNTYRIDKRRIFFAGNSAGAILAEQLAFIDSAAQCPPLLAAVVRKYLPAAGALPPHTIRAYISLAGAVLDTALITPNRPPLLHIQGDADRIVPYGYKRAMEGIAPFKLAGLAASRPRYLSQHINFTEYIFKNAGHTPWDQEDPAFDTVMHQVIDFLYQKLK